MKSVLLIGIGGYGEKYLDQAFAHAPERFLITGILDPFAQRSPRYPEILKAGYRLFPTLDAALDAKPDLVVISSPIHTHASYVRAVLMRHIPVLCEKPFCMDEKEVESLMALEKESGAFVAIGFQLCYRPDVQALKKDIMAGRYGAPVLFKTLRLMRRGMNYYSRASWAGMREVKGLPVYDSPLANAAAHEFEFLVYLLGQKLESTAKVESLEGVSYRANPHIENFDAVALVAKSDEGVPLFYYAAHCLSEAKVGPFAELRFENATVRLEKGSYHAYAPDGSLIEDYAHYGQGESMQKLSDVLAHIDQITVPICPIEAGLSHLHAVLMMDKIPIERVEVPEVVIDDDITYPIPYLSEVFLDSYKKEVLPKRDAFRIKN